MSTGNLERKRTVKSRAEMGSESERETKRD